MPKNRTRVLAELHSLNNIIRGFCENFDCEDIPCAECPIGPDICIAIGKDNLVKKYGIQGHIHRFIDEYWKDILIVILLIHLLGTVLSWW